MKENSRNKILMVDDRAENLFALDVILSNENYVCVKAKSGKEALKIPVAHGEGRYFASDADLELLHKNKQVVYRYCDQLGTINLESNPNGAMENIAGISNIAGNVVGMMPHPERACNKNLENEDGRIVFNKLFGIS